MKHSNTSHSLLLVFVGSPLLPPFDFTVPHPLPPTSAIRLSFQPATLALLAQPFLPSCVLLQSASLHFSLLVLTARCAVHAGLLKNLLSFFSPQHSFDCPYPTILPFYLIVFLKSLYPFVDEFVITAILMLCLRDIQFLLLNNDYLIEHKNVFRNMWNCYTDHLIEYNKCLIKSGID